MATCTGTRTESAPGAEPCSRHSCSSPCSLLGSFTHPCWFWWQGTQPRAGCPAPVPLPTPGAAAFSLLLGGPKLSPQRWPPAAVLPGRWGPGAVPCSHSRGAAPVRCRLAEPPATGAAGRTQPRGQEGTGRGLPGKGPAAPSRGRRPHGGHRARPRHQGWPSGAAGGSGRAAGRGRHRSPLPAARLPSSAARPCPPHPRLPPGPPGTPGGRHRPALLRAPAGSRLPAGSPQPPGAPPSGAVPEPSRGRPPAPYLSRRGAEQQQQQQRGGAAHGRGTAEARGRPQLSAAPRSQRGRAGPGCGFLPAAPPARPGPARGSPAPALLKGLGRRAGGRRCPGPPRARSCPCCQPGGASPPGGFVAARAALNGGVPLSGLTGGRLKALKKGRLSVKKWSLVEAL